MKSQFEAYLTVAGTPCHGVFFAPRAIRVPERLRLPSAALAFLPT
jgi:hypothetical protein